MIVALSILAAVVRFATLSSQSYWFDEAQAAHEMHLSLSGLFSTLGSQETSPPLYFVLAWIWAKALGTGEAGLRSLSAVAGVAVIPLAYLSGRELVSRRAGLIAAALAALSPFMIWYSQEAREYMLTAALCSASFLFFARSWRAPTTRNLAWWAGFSALALLTHFYAGFLVAPEALWLLYAIRTRGLFVASAALVAVEGALAPLAISDTSHPIGWITVFPLSTRIQQVPVVFGLGQLYKNGSVVNYGLVGAAVLVACLILLLVIGADAKQLRGAGIAAGVVAFMVLVPLLLAVLGHDYYIARALIPGWVPLAVLIGAACASPRARVPGAVLAVVLLAAFIIGSIQIGDHPVDYQRANWRAVARALGPAIRPRAVLVYEGSLGAGPLSLYLHGVPWAGNDATSPSTPEPVTVSELDAVGNAAQLPLSKPPAGIRLIASRKVAGYTVARFALTSAWRLPPASIPDRAGPLLAPVPPRPVVLIQPAG